jgi:HK97 family phage major capsid protein
MESIQDLRERRAAKASESRKLLDAHKGGHLPADVSDKIDTLYNEITAIDNTIEKIERQLQVDAADKLDRLHARDHAPDSGKLLFNKWLRGGDTALSAEEWTKVRATMSTTTGSEGGFTVPSMISSQLYDSMKAFGAMRSVADIIRTADGRPLSFPGSDGTAEVGEVIAQNVTATAADPTFTSSSLNVFKYSSKIVAAPFELLQDSTIDMEAFIRVRLAQRLGRIGNQHFSTGGGTTVPDGVVPRSSLGKVGTTGQTLTIIYDDIVDVIHAVDPSYRSAGAAFMTSDSLLKVIRKLKDSQNMPIWLPNRNAGVAVASRGTLDGGYTAQDQAAVFDTLLGYPVYVNNDMAVPAANAKSLVFGDFSYYKIRDAMDVQMFRFTDSAYTKLGQVAFLAWARMGGNLLDTKAVVYYAHSAT